MYFTDLTLLTMIILTYIYPNRIEYTIMMCKCKDMTKYGIKFFGSLLDLQRLRDPAQGNLLDLSSKS